MLELPPRFLNGQYVGRYRRGVHGGGADGRLSEEAEEDEDESSFWRYESKEVDVSRLLAGQVRVVGVEQAADDCVST